MLKRIVPLAAALFALPAAADQLTYHGGHLLTAPRYVNVFWGSYWNNRSEVGTLNQFTSFIAGSSDYNGALQEYAVPGFPIRPGSFDGGYVIQSSPGSTVEDIN